MKKSFFNFDNGDMAMDIDTGDIHMISPWSNEEEYD